MTKLQETVINLRLPWWGLFAGLIASLIIISGCDPNDFNAQVAYQQTRNPAPQLINGRVALIGCRRDPVPVLRDPRGRPLQGTQMQGGRGVVNPSIPGLIKVVSIDTTLAYNYAANRYRQGIPFGRSSGVSAFITNIQVPGCEDPTDIVFNHAGNLAMAACRGSDKVAAISVYPNGQASLIDVYPVIKPSRIAFTEEDDFAFVVSDGSQSNNGIAAFDLTRLDAFGTPYPRSYGSIIRPLSGFAGNYKINDIAIGKDLDGQNHQMIYLAVSSSAGGGLVPLDIEVALHRVIPDLRAPILPANPQAVYSGVTTPPRLYPGLSLNIVALSPSDTVPIALGNSLGMGLVPFGVVDGYGEIAPIALNQDPNLANVPQGAFGLNPEMLRNIRDAEFVPNSASGVALASNQVIAYDVRQEGVLGFHPEPIKLDATGYERLAVDPQGEFMLAMNPQKNTFSILRIESNGLISYNGRSDTVNTDRYCIGPQAAAVQPRQLSTPALPIHLQQQQQLEQQQLVQP